ncbi:MAG: GTP-binding protein [Clostridia bacterium]|nr:GTP-binding protein [Clostridia bacterium]
MTKIDIISGFLGAGKTTLIKKMIAEAYVGEKLVLIENEFGEIGIDGGFLRDSGIQINEMNSGCICCSLVGDFSRALAEVLETYHPDRVLIEPSGVGKLSDVIRAAEGVEAGDAALSSFVTVVDAKKCKMYLKNFGEFFCDQVEHAGTIVLSHTDGMSDEKLAACVALLREHNAMATIVTTPWGEIDGKQILAAIEKTDSLAVELDRLHKEVEHHHHDHHHDEECGCHDHHDHDHHHHDHDDDHDHHEHEEHCTCGCHDHDHDHDHHHYDHEHEHHHDHDYHHQERDEHCTCGCHDHDHHHHHHADEVFSSFGTETARRYSAAAIKEALEAFANGTEYGMILRAKGIVAGEDGQWIHFDYVPGEPDVRSGSADVTGRICVIGAELDKEKIAHLFGV